MSKNIPLAIINIINTFNIEIKFLTKMKKLFFIPLLISFLFIVTSCQKDDNNTPKASGKITFNYTSIVNGLKKASSQNLTDSSSNSGTPAAIIISITDNSGNVVTNMEEVPLYNMNGYYISRPISLEQGGYKLSDFLVVDKDGNVLYITPKEGSPKAYLVNDPLPIEFNVVKDQVTNVPVEVLENTGETPEEYGYTTFSFNVIDVINFYVSVFTYSDLNHNFELTNSEIQIFKDNSKIYEGTLSATINNIQLRNEAGDYSIVVSKSGYKNYTTSLTLSDLQNHTVTTPLVVILSKSDFPTDGLVAYYPFNGNANDLTSNHLDCNSNATLTTDRNGNLNNAYHFNGTNQYIDFPNDSRLKPQFPFTISYWVKLEQYDYSNQMLTTDYQLDNYTGVWFCISNNGRIILNYGNGEYVSVDSRKSMVGETILNLNQWYHVVGVFKSASEMEIYLNGVNDGGVYTGYAESLVYSNNPGSIGRKDCGNSTQAPYYFLGSIDDVAIYNKALSQSEITLLYNH